MILEVFWDEKNSLAGISLTLKGETRLLVGRNISTEGVRLGQAMFLDEGDWIMGLILHIPTLDFGRAETRRWHYAKPLEDSNGRAHTSPKE